MRTAGRHLGATSGRGAGDGRGRPRPPSPAIYAGSSKTCLHAKPSKRNRRGPQWIEVRRPSPTEFGHNMRGDQWGTARGARARGRRSDALGTRDSMAN
eukprot:1213432-Pyramimonas_sp.AAC.1